MTNHSASMSFPLKWTMSLLIAQQKIPTKMNFITTFSNMMTWPRAFLFCHRNFGCRKKTCPTPPSEWPVVGRPLHGHPSNSNTSEDGPYDLFLSLGVTASPTVLKRLGGGKKHQGSIRTVFKKPKVFKRMRILRFTVIHPTKKWIRNSVKNPQNVGPEICGGLVEMVRVLGVNL